MLICSSHFSHCSTDQVMATTAANRDDVKLFNIQMGPPEARIQERIHWKLNEAGDKWGLFVTLPSSGKDYFLASGPLDEDPAAIVDRARKEVPMLAYPNLIPLDGGKGKIFIPGDGDW
jgi:hypothetical protein